MEEQTLGQLLANLTDAVAEYQGLVNKMFAIHSDRIELCDEMVRELRDDTHESLSALGNRVEGLTRAVTTEPAEVAQMIVNNELAERKRKWGV